MQSLATIFRSLFSVRAFCGSGKLTVSLVVLYVTLLNLVGLASTVDHLSLLMVRELDCDLLQLPVEVCTVSALHQRTNRPSKRKKTSSLYRYLRVEFTIWISSTKVDIWEVKYIGRVLHEGPVNQLLVRFFKKYGILWVGTAVDMVERERLI
jgi:hypothetical protein